MNKKLQNKLKAYSALTILAGLGASDANAGVIVTDIDYTSSGTDSYDVDIDGDGTTDFVLDLAYNSSYAVGIVNLEIENGNGVIGATSSDGFGTYLYAENLNQKDEIGPNQVFFTSYSLAELNFQGGFNGQFIGTDGYVGVSFDISGETHYGYIRLETSDSGDEFTIYEVAYNDIAGDAIGAGNTVSIEEQSAIEFNVNSADGNINITTDALNSKVDVLNIQGQVIASEVITANKTVISNNFASGIYIVNITDGRGKAVSRKITL